MHNITANDQILSFRAKFIRSKLEVHEYFMGSKLDSIKCSGGANLTLSDGDMDPYVNILLDGKQVGETETAEAGGNPVYNYEFETLLRSTGKRLTDHVIEFVVYDWDR